MEEARCFGWIDSILKGVDKDRFPNKPRGTSGFLHPGRSGRCPITVCIVRRAVPDATKKAYPGWRILGYRHFVEGYFRGIFHYENRMDLAFDWEVSLPDTDRILKPGAGKLKRVRHIRFYEKKNLDRQNPEKLLNIAVTVRGYNDRQG